MLLPWLQGAAESGREGSAAGTTQAATHSLSGNAGRAQADPLVITSLGSMPVRTTLVSEAGAVREDWPNRR